MKRIAVRCVIALLLSAVVGFAGCRALLLNKLESHDNAGAVSCAIDLKKRGHLPGFEPTDHGTITLSAADILGDDEQQYPRKVTVWAKKDADGADYFYAFAKRFPESEWSLVGAWKKVGGTTEWYLDENDIQRWQGEREGAGLDL